MMMREDFKWFIVVGKNCWYKAPDRSPVCVQVKNLVFLFFSRNELLQEWQHKSLLIFEPSWSFVRIELINIVITIKFTDNSCSTGITRFYPVIPTGIVPAHIAGWRRSQSKTGTIRGSNNSYIRTRIVAHACDSLPFLPNSVPIRSDS